MSSLRQILLEYKNPLVVFAFGILIGFTFYYRNLNLIILWILIFIFLIISLKKKRFLILLVSVLIGYFYPYFYIKTSNFNADSLIEKKKIFIGEIISAPKNGMFCKKYLFKVKRVIGEDISKEFKVLVKGSKYEEYQRGDIVRLKGKVKSPRRADLPGLYDEKKYLFVNGVNYVIDADHGSLVFLEESKFALAQRGIDKLRDKLLAINQKSLSGQNLSLINGIVYGGKASNLSEDLKEKIRSLGLSHITSASGFNVSILAGFVFYLCRLLKRRKKLPYFLSIFAVLTYTALADFSPSVVRACLFIILVLVAGLINKKIKILPTVCLILVLFFIQNPMNILDIGLQLSIMSFLGLLLYFNEVQDNITLFISNYLKPIITLFFQSLIAQIFVIPLIIFYFHNIQLLGLISNLLAVPIASLILILGLINIPFSFIPGLNCVVGFLLKLFSGLFILWTNLLDQITIKEIIIPNINFYILILIYIFIIYFLSSLFIQELKQKALVVFIGFVLVLFITYILTDTSKYLKIFCLSKYNKDITVIVSSNESPIYISNKFNDKDINQVKQYLKLNNISRKLKLYDQSKNGNLKITHGNFSFEIIGNYQSRDMPCRSQSERASPLAGHVSTTDSSFVFVKLPALKKGDPDFQMIFQSVPKNLIIYDCKKLSKSSNENIRWLKSLNSNTYFLSETGTVEIITDGRKYNVVQLFK